LLQEIIQITLFLNY